MVCSINSFISISLSCQAHSFLQYFQNLGPENPGNELSKIVVNKQLKFLKTYFKPPDI